MGREKSKWTCRHPSTLPSHATKIFLSCVGFFGHGIIVGAISIHPSQDKGKFVTPLARHVLLLKGTISMVEGREWLMSITLTWICSLQQTHIPTCIQIASSWLSCLHLVVMLHPRGIGNFHVEIQPPDLAPIDFDS